MCICILYGVMSRSAAVWLCTLEMSYNGRNEWTQQTLASQLTTNDYRNNAVNQSYVVNCALRKRKANILFTPTVYVQGCTVDMRHTAVRAIYWDCTNRQHLDCEYADQLIFVYQLFDMRHRIGSEFFTHVYLFCCEFPHDMFEVGRKSKLLK